jgi:hypothetical protein
VRKSCTDVVLTPVSRLHPCKSVTGPWGTSLVNVCGSERAPARESRPGEPCFSTEVRFSRLTGLSVWRIVVRMPETIAVPMVIELFQCQKCKHRWVPENKSKPARRCPNDGCRTMRWDAKRYPNAFGPAPMPPPPGNGGGGGEEISVPPSGQRISYQTLPLGATRKPAAPASSHKNPEAGYVIAA